ncbi:hypothetical protein [Streptomyces sp. 900105245]
MANNDLHMIAIGVDNNAYHDIRLANGTWQGWQPIPGHGAATMGASRVSLAGMPNGDVAVAVLDGSGVLYVNTRSANPAPSWTGWVAAKGPTGRANFTGRALSIAANSDGSSRIVAIDADDIIWSITYKRDGTWGNWAMVSRDHQAYEVSLAKSDTAPGLAEIQALILGTDGIVYFTRLSAQGVWDSPSKVAPLEGSMVALANIPNSGCSFALLSTAKPCTKYFVNNTPWPLSVSLNVREGATVGENDLSVKFDIEARQQQQVTYSAHENAKLDGILLNFVDSNELYAQQLIVVTAGSTVDQEINNSSQITFNPGPNQDSVFMSFSK